ncbi:MAG: NAD(P)-dependent oxidoreductase [Bacteroidales bacterium]|nr:NAD(P)-dependent oxidoreductase [Bacteroidales bacterium]
MKIFITGATGFIGKHLVKKLVEEDHEITINLFGEEQSPFDDTVFTYKLNETNIPKDTEYLIRESFDGIIHLASLYLTIHKPEDAVKLIDSNVRFSTYILECASQAKLKWFINTGTFWQNYQNADYSPVNLYAATKQAFESIAKYYIETNQIKFATLRLCDTYGPDDTRPKIFNLWELIAKSGESLDMSAGEQLIDISYIDDIVDAFLLLANHLQTDHPDISNGAVYAVKAEKLYTLKELAAIFEEATSFKLNINWGEKPYRDREVMIPWGKGSIVPGWMPKIDVQDGINLTFKSLK